MSQVLTWTGNALVDVGIAALCALASKDSPELLTLDDLDRAASEMEEYYFSGALTSYLTCVFMNAEYVQPGEGAKKEESRRRYARRVLFAHRHGGDPGASGMTCAFSGQPATHLIHRGQMPLLTGEGVLNFVPAGRGALPIAGPYLTAVQALPLGGRRCEGKLLVAHADEPALTVALARVYVADNRRLLQLCKLGALPAKDGPDASLEREQASWDAAKKRPKYPDAKAAPSLIIADLMQIWQRGGRKAGKGSLSVYWLSSSGQGPSLEVFHLPSNLLGFVRRAGAAPTRQQWLALVGAGWQAVEAKPEKAAAGKTKPKGKRGQSQALPGGAGRSRNRVLSDLFAIYERGFTDLTAAQAFVRRHLLTIIEGRLRRVEEPDWELTELFLREVLGMEQQRVDAIKSFADHLAEHIRKRNDRGLFRDLVYLRKPYEFRNVLTKAQRNEARSGGGLLFGLDEYLSVFEADDAVGRLDWSLVRDLVSIRLIEQLQKAGWLTTEALGEGEPDESAA